MVVVTPAFHPSAFGQRAPKTLAAADRGNLRFQTRNPRKDAVLLASDRPCGAENAQPIDRSEDACGIGQSIGRLHVKAPTKASCSHAAGALVEVDRDEVCYRTVETSRCCRLRPIRRCEPPAVHASPCSQRACR